jgi:hypothetical protein
MHIQLSHQVGAVILCGFGADIEHPGNIGIAIAGNDLMQDLALAAGKPTDFTGFTGQ